MKARLISVLVAGAMAIGCEGDLVVDVGAGGGGGGSGPPQIAWDAGPGGGGPPTPYDGGAGPMPACDLPDEGYCDGDIARWCEGGVERMQDCAAMGQVCEVVGVVVACLSSDAPNPDPSPDPDPTPDPDPDPAPTGCAGPEEQEVIELTNGERGSPLTCDEDMARAARKHSQDMCDQGYFSHTSRDGRSPFQRMEDEGVSYRTAGENIAMGQRTPADVHRAWMNSSGHRRNIVNTSYGRIGVGYVDCGGTPYWTQVFAD